MEQAQTMLDQMSLRNLDASDAFKLALHSSGKTVSQVAEEMKWTDAVANRVFRYGRYYPSFEDIPRLCRVFGNSILIQWLQVRALHSGLEEVHMSVDCRTLLARIGELFSEMGEVGQQGAKAAEDGVLEVKEIRRVISEINDVLEKGGALLGDLRALERSMIEEEKK